MLFKLKVTTGKFLTVMTARFQNSQMITKIESLNFTIMPTTRVIQATVITSLK